MSKPTEAIIVIGDRVIRVPLKVLDLYADCAGQMINDGDHFDYYKGRVRMNTLVDLGHFHTQLGSLT